MMNKRPTSSAGISQIPVSTRKLNLFTPKNKRPMSMASTSTVKSFTQTASKYQSKPAPNRDESRQMFERLLKFLEDNKYPHPLPEAKRFFLAVSSSEASRIFEALFKIITGKFKMTKMEEDVPLMLGHLNYPYLRTVTKSSLVSIATRQAACNLLVIYDWLIDMANMILNADNQTSSLQGEALVDGYPDAELLELLHNPEMQDGDAPLKRLAEKYNGSEEQLQEAELELARVSKINEELNVQLKEVEALKEEDACLDEDIKSYDVYIEKMGDHLDYWTNQEKELNKQLQEGMSVEKIDEQILKLDINHMNHLLQLVPYPNMLTSSLTEIEDSIQRIENSTDLIKCKQELLNRLPLIKKDIEEEEKREDGKLLSLEKMLAKLQEENKSLETETEELRLDNEATLKKNEQEIRKKEQETVNRKEMPSLEEKALDGECDELQEVLNQKNQEIENALQIDRLDAELDEVVIKEIKQRMRAEMSAETKVRQDFLAKLRTDQAEREANFSKMKRDWAPVRRFIKREIENRKRESTLN